MPANQPVNEPSLNNSTEEDEDDEEEGGADDDEDWASEWDALATPEPIIDKEKDVVFHEKVWPQPQLPPANVHHGDAPGPSVQPVNAQPNRLETPECIQPCTQPPYIPEACPALPRALPPPLPMDEAPLPYNPQNELVPYSAPPQACEMPTFDFNANPFPDMVLDQFDAEMPPPRRAPPRRRATISRGDRILNGRIVCPSLTAPLSSDAREKSKNAARTRRSKEKDAFSELAKVVPILDHVANTLDKASIARIAVSILKYRNIYPYGESTIFIQSFR